MATYQQAATYLFHKLTPDPARYTAEEQDAIKGALATIVQDEVERPAYDGPARIRRGRRTRRQTHTPRPQSDRQLVYRNGAWVYLDAAGNFLKPA